jgi:RNA polymerase sigma-70 factor (ECF subfamily)
MTPLPLTRLLRDAAVTPPTDSDHPEDGDTLETLLAQVVQTAKTKWPTIDLKPEQFIPYLARRLPAETPPGQALGQLRTSDLYLACACALGDTEAIATFDTYCLSVIDPALAALSIGADVASEVKQQLRRSLLVADDGPPEIADFAGRGDLRGWVRVMAVRAALQQTKRARRDVPVDDELFERASSPQESPELAYLKGHYRSEFKAAVGEAMRSLAVRDRTLLRQHYLDELTIDELGTAYHVHRATAARWLESARQKIMQATRASLTRRLAVQSIEFDSIIRLISSQLDMSLRHFFRQGRGPTK